jgi:hypothetical protein
MGFVWFRSEWTWEKQIVPGLEAYKAIHGDLEEICGPCERG